MRIMEALDVSTTWDVSTTIPEGKKIITQDGMIDIFRSNKATEEQVVAHSLLVWVSTAHDVDTP